LIGVTNVTDFVEIITGLDAGYRKAVQEKGASKNG
jgi:hypothetical protein